MKQTLFGLASLLALGTSTVAQYTNQSAPFYLVLHSKDEKYNGTALSPCHEGAAIEALCIGGVLNSTSNSATYQFNTSSAEYVENASLGATGYLTYELEGANSNGKLASQQPHGSESMPITPFVRRIRADATLLRSIHQRCAAALRAI